MRGEQLAGAIAPRGVIEVDDADYAVESVFTMKVVSQQEVFDVVKSLRGRSAPGWDLAKAFDSVDRTKLISKLKTIGFEGTFVDWFVSYLDSHLQFVFINGSKSDNSVLQYGILAWGGASAAVLEPLAVTQRDEPPQVVKTSHPQNAGADIVTRQQYMDLLYQAARQLVKPGEHYSSARDKFHTQSANELNTRVNSSVALVSGKTGSGMGSAPPFCSLEKNREAGTTITVLFY
ncbi:hypothetical protein J6590_070100 [Homalodisca vitripennis]|nr:hypothetical protein J6590_070100 [Homalodisca vitripennis]